MLEMLPPVPADAVRDNARRVLALARATRDPVLRRLAREAMVAAAEAEAEALEASVVDPLSILATLSDCGARRGVPLTD